MPISAISNMGALGFLSTARMSLELKMEVWDSPNSAGVVIDAIRCCKLALDRGLKGELIAPSAYFMKSPPVQYTDDEAHRMVEEFIAAAHQAEEEEATKQVRQEISGQS